MHINQVELIPARARSDPGQSVGDPIVNPGRIAQLALAAARGISQLSCALGAQLYLRYQPINRESCDVSADISVTICYDISAAISYDIHVAADISHNIATDIYRHEIYRTIYLLL